MNTHFSVLDPAALELPVLNPQRIRDLGEELDSSAGAHAFLGNYLEMLPDRLSMVAKAVCAGDVETAMDRALSLKVTSTMVGALQLAALAETMEALICRGDWAAAEPLLDLLAPAVAAVRTAGAVVVNGLLQP
ncbi:Hpt domain-containing protein [Pseudarthrobacter sp. fls2-241-R2A-127]|uniref:Hpt domain-containing protein n=1 Tax=Pseudarthrobacter sp. fls2-241-R2A-127 TaxID=3040303 RepID=UPI002554DC98|nr:Hpt domain-containing protein [Pseudarthrobacter sp. fls2-241-R2A-127]